MSRSERPKRHNHDPNGFTHDLVRLSDRCVGREHGQLMALPQVFEAELAGNRMCVSLA
jgi:hypothetical protein